MIVCGFGQHKCRKKILAVLIYFCFVFAFDFVVFVFFIFFFLFSLFQLDKIVKEKETQFTEEKNNMWKELTEAFQKVFIAVGRTDFYTTTLWGAIVCGISWITSSSNTLGR